MNTKCFALLIDADTGEEKPVILKSRALKHFIEVDGMSAEDALEFWDFNTEGSKGSDSYSVVDDTLDNDEIAERLANE